MVVWSARVSLLLFSLLGAFSVVPLPHDWLSPAAAQEGAPAEGPADRAVGTVSGAVLDARTGSPIGDAGVELVGTGQTVRTDLNGRYTIKAPPGTYELRIFSPSYRSTRLEDVVIVAGEVKMLDASLEHTALAGVEVIEVVGQATQSSETTQLLLRKKAAVVSDTLSAEMIQKSPGSAAADLVKRAPAVTVKDDKFVFVRGLGERYSYATLNGSKLPSTDPERRAVPLDLFPSDFLESLAVIKSYTPDLPGDFSGGLADLQLRSFPPALQYSMQLEGGGNTQTTFRTFRDYRGSTYDAFGFGKTFRDIPNGVPGAIDNTDPERFSFGRRFRNIWSVDRTTAPPDYEMSASVGNTLGPLGFQLGGTFANQWRRRNEVDNTYRNFGDLDAPEIGLYDKFESERNTFESRLGGLLTTAYKIGWDHQITLRGLFNQGSTDQVRLSTGETSNLGLDSGIIQEQIEFEYTEEQLIYGQFAGEHQFPFVRADWRTAISQTRWDQPDVRYQTRNGPAGEPLLFVDDSLGGQRLFNSLQEVLSDSALDLTLPFETQLPFTDFWSGLEAKAKAGWGYLWRDRDFSQRRFRYIVSPGSFDLTLPTEVLLQPGNIRAGGVDFEELTNPRDQFHANQQTLAGYGMLDLPIWRDQVRVIGGVRYETDDINLDVFDELTAEFGTIKKENQDWLPGVNVVVSPLPDMNFRFGFSQTVSRPDFRELSPAEFPAQRGERAKVGNPDLVQANITSYDARWEWFFSTTELVSASFFYKKLERPIEQIVIQRASDQANSFANADSGDILGVELEGRKDLGFLWSPLRNLSILSNVTWANSEVTAPPASTLEVQTNTTRKLQGQPDLIVNASIEYSHPDWGTARLLYLTADDQIASIGTFGLPDIIETRRDQLDAVLIMPLNRFGIPLRAKLSVSNLLNDPVEFTQGGETQERYTSGISVGFSLTYSQ
jgi:hypothetical protein